MSKPVFHPQQYDLTSKDLFKDIDRGLVRWLTGKEPSGLQWLDVSFPTVGELKADLVFQAVLEGQAWIFHLELQSSNDSAMAYRMLRYWSHIHQTYHKPVYQSVLYMGSAPLNMESSLVQKQASEVGLEYHFRLIDLSQVSAEELLSLKEPAFLSLLPLSGMVKERTEQELEACVSYLLEHTQEVGIEERRNLLLRTEILSGLRFEQSVIEAIFREVEQMLVIQESAGYKRIYEKGLEKGHEEGLQEGRQEGLQAGRQVAIEKFQGKIIEVLKKRFSVLPLGIVNEIKQIQDLDVLDLALSNALDCESLEVFLQTLKS